MADIIDTQISELRKERAEVMDHKKSVTMELQELENHILEEGNKLSDKEKKECNEKVSMMEKAIAECTTNIQKLSKDINELESAKAMRESKLNAAEVTEEMSSVVEDLTKGKTVELQGRAVPTNKVPEKDEDTVEELTPEAREQLIDQIKQEILSEEDVQEAIENYKKTVPEKSYKGFSFYIHAGEPIVFAVPKTRAFINSYSKLSLENTDQIASMNLQKIANGFKLASEYMVYPPVIGKTSDEAEDVLSPGVAALFFEKLLESAGYTAEFTQSIEV